MCFAINTSHVAKSFASKTEHKQLRLMKFMAAVDLPHTYICLVLKLSTVKAKAITLCTSHLTITNNTKS